MALPRGWALSKRKQQEPRRAARKASAQRTALVQRDVHGRPHLLVRQDERGAVVALGLSAPLFEERWQNDVALAAATTANSLMTPGHTRENAVALGKNAMAGTSTIAEGALSRAVDGQHPACHSGCAHCCYQAVGVSVPEVLAIHEHLLATRSSAELELLTQKLRKLDDVTRGMTPAARFSPELPCPFLEQQRCTIYEVRPLACRGTNSLDAAACEQNLHDAGTRARFLSGALSVPCFLEPIRAFHAVAAGVQLALGELHGLEVAPLDLTAAMRVLFDDPAAVTEAWLDGQAPFEAAHGADTTLDPLIRKMSGRRVS